MPIKITEIPYENLLPEILVDSTPVQAVERLVKAHQYAQASAVAHLIGTSQMAPSVQEMLREVGEHLRYKCFSSESVAKQSLAWAAKMIEWGANPFAYQGEPGAWGYKPSFFEQLVSGGYWSYAQRLSESEPQKANLAKEAMDRIAQESNKRKLLQSKVVVHQLLTNAGSKALELGFSLGFNPKEKVMDQPWFFSCIDAESLKAFVKVGVDPTEKNSLGETLSEVIAKRPSSRVRQKLLSLARHVQSTAGAVNKESAVREALALARAGSGSREVIQAAKAAGMEAKNIKSPEGMPMLGVAIESSHWSLTTELLKSGANVAALTPQGIPLGVLAIATSYAHLPASSVKQDKAKACIVQLIDGLDFTWRSAEGLKMLEALAKAHKDQHHGHQLKMNYASMSHWIKTEPIDVSNPLWMRLAQLEQDASLIRRCAEQRPEEPWSSQGGMLMETLLMARIPEQFGTPSWGIADEMNGFMQHANKGDGARERMERIGAPEQWEATFASFWTEFNQGKTSEYQLDKKATRIESLMEYWVNTSKKLDLEAFDIERLSKSILSGWERLLQENSSLWVERWIENFTKKLCKILPGQAGVILLDILNLPGQMPLTLGFRVWNYCQKEKIQLVLPESHRLLSESNRVTPELANHPVWHHIEAHLVEKSIVVKKRLRL